MTLQFLPDAEIAYLNDYVSAGVFETDTGVVTKDKTAYTYMLEVRVIETQWNGIMQVMYEIPKNPKSADESVGVYERALGGGWRIVSSDAWSDSRAQDITEDYTFSKQHITDEIGKADTKAANAQTAADNAQTKANKAETDAATADAKAVAADGKAVAAQGTADNAVTAAANAQTKADKAETDAANAQSKADKAEGDAATVATNLAQVKTDLEGQINSIISAADPVELPFQPLPLGSVVDAPLSSVRRQGLVTGIGVVFEVPAGGEIQEILQITSDKFFPEDEPIEVVAQLGNSKQTYSGTLDKDGLVKLKTKVKFPANIEFVINKVVLALA